MEDTSFLRLSPFSSVKRTTKEFVRLIFCEDTSDKMTIASKHEHPSRNSDSNQVSDGYLPTQGSFIATAYMD